MSRLAAISVDLDSLGHYCRIQGLDESVLTDEARALVATKAVPRLLELFAEARTAATFFVIAGDLGGALSTALKRANAAGVELASHSYSHAYDLSRWPAADIADDLAKADARIEAETGVRPRGFRAPGYTMSPALWKAIEGRGYVYDSSTYPAVPYYLLKASVMGVLKAIGRPSRAVLDRARVLTAPAQPYHPSSDEPYAIGSSSVVELPMAVTPVVRAPFIGTTVTMLPWLVVEGAFRSLSALPFINFELHAIDVLDVSDGVPEVLARQQRDVRIPVREKLRRLRAVFSWLGDERERVTVLEAAQRADALRADVA